MIAFPTAWMGDLAMRSALPSAREYLTQSKAFALKFAKLALALLLPALAILCAAFVQEMTTRLWPSIRYRPSVIVSLDSWLTDLVMMALCLLAGIWTRRKVGTVGSLLLMVSVPLAFLDFQSMGMAHAPGSVAWRNPLTWFTIFTAAAPLLGVACGWWIAGRRTGQRH